MGIRVGASGKGDSYKALNIMAIAAGRIVGNMGEKQELEAMERI